MTVAKAGTGSGVVASSPPGIACGGACSSLFDDGANVALTATPAPGSAFAGWSGACTGAGECALAMSADRTVTVTFDRPSVVPVPASSHPPVLAGVTQSHALWREGTAPARLSRATRRRAPLGTTFAFTLDQPASVRFAFVQSVRGRRVKGRCVAQTQKNRHMRACVRSVTRGTLVLVAHAGANRLAFQGRITRAKKLPLGAYALVITATNSFGQRSSAPSLHFTIVK